MAIMLRVNEKEKEREETTQAGVYVAVVESYCDDSYCSSFKSNRFILYW